VIYDSYTSCFFTNFFYTPKILPAKRTAKECPQISFILSTTYFSSLFCNQVKFSKRIAKFRVIKCKPVLFFMTSVMYVICPSDCSSARDAGGTLTFYRLMSPNAKFLQETTAPTSLFLSCTTPFSCLLDRDALSFLTTF
jgi:hypothetical protein